RQAVDRRLRGDIGNAVGIADQPGDRAEIDDGPTAGIAHLRAHRLGSEELVLEVDRHAVVPISGGYVGGPVAVVVAGIVDQYLDRSFLVPRLCDRRLQPADIPEVEGNEARPPMAARGDALDQGLRWLLLQVDEGDARPLRGEVLDDA